MVKELELIKYRAEVSALSTFSNFKGKIVHFATNPEADPHRMLPCAVIADHQAGAFEIWWLLTDANFDAAKSARNDPEFLFRHARNAQEAHCFIPCPNGTYLTFFEKSSIGIRFDPQNGKAFLFDTLEAFGKDSRVESFGITAYANDDPEADFFYASCMKSRPDGKREVLDVKLAYDFSYWETVRSDVGDAELRLNSPHMTRFQDGTIFDSHFKDVSYRVPTLGEGEISRHVLVETGFRKAFELYRNVAGLSVDESFEDHCVTDDGSVSRISEGFSKFAERLKVELKAETLGDLICEKLLPNAELLPGKISYFRIDEPESVRTAATAKGSPAHFEFSEDGKRTYVSSHNFDILCDSLRYFGPAAIDRFDLIDGKMTRTGTFETPEGYRFTSHRTFRFRDKEYVATIGQPNRFYVIDADTMEKKFHTDMGETRLDEFHGIALDRWVRSTHSDPQYPFYRPFEISEDGEFAYVPNKRGATYVSATNRNVMKRFVSFELCGPEMAEKFRMLNALNAHCYRF